MSACPSSIDFSLCDWRMHRHRSQTKKSMLLRKALCDQYPSVYNERVTKFEEGSINAA